MFRALRSIGAVLIGVIVAFVLVAVTDGLSQQFIYSLPEGIDPNNYAQLKSIMANIPARALLFMLGGWALAAFVGTSLAAWVAGRSPRVHGLIVGGLFILAVVANMLLLPHPAWFWIVSLPLLLLAVYFGATRVKANPLSVAA